MHIWYKKSLGHNMESDISNACATNAINFYSQSDRLTDQQNGANFDTFFMPDFKL